MIICTQKMMQKNYITFYITITLLVVTPNSAAVLFLEVPPLYRHSIVFSLERRKHSENNKHQSISLIVKQLFTFFHRIQMINFSYQKS